MEQLVHPIYQPYGRPGILGAALPVGVVGYVVLSCWQDRGK
jgi:hypothetical protein